MEEINAILGIDIEKSTPEQVAKRAGEFCLEMADCYEDHPLAREAFESLSVIINLIRGGR